MRGTKIDSRQGIIDTTAGIEPCKRKYQRQFVPGFIVDLADGDRIIGGNVKNFSASGFQLTSLPRSFTPDSTFYTAILSGAGRHYRVLARPCWKKNRGEYSMDIGFKIIDAPWQWLEFTLHNQS